MLETIWLPLDTRSNANIGRAHSVRYAAMWIVCLSLIAVCLMTGCASGTMPTQAVTLRLPPALTAPCPVTLPKAESGSLRDLLNNHIEIARAYYECADKHNELSRLIDERNYPN